MHRDTAKLRTERFIGVAAAGLITAGILLAAAYGVLFLQQTPAVLVLVLIHILYVFCLARAPVLQHWFHKAAAFTTD